MANILKIKRSTTQASPAALEQGELAYSESTGAGDGELFIGIAGAGIEKIGGYKDVQKLVGIEDGATADQTPAQIKVAYESNADTNEFSDAEQTKLANIEAGAQPDMSDAEIKVAYENNADTNEFSDAEQTKLAGIASGAQPDQTPAEIKTAYESNANTNEFSDTEQSKLAGIAAGATVNSPDATLLARANHTGQEGTADIANNAVTYAKIQTMAGANTILGNNSGGGSTVTELTAGQVRTILNVTDGADKTDATSVAAAGAVMEVDTSTVNMQFVVNEPTLVSNSPTKVPTQQSVKTYVDNAVTGGLVYQGQYNAATNTPDLDTTPIGGILQGHFWKVSVAGTFFSVPVSVGDELIANTDAPSVEGDWDIVPLTINDATEADKGIVRLATAAETNTGTSNAISVHPAGLTAWTGSGNITQVGTISSGVWNGTPIAGSSLPSASYTVKGIIEIATQAEVDLMTSALLAVTPLTLHNTTLDGGTF